MNSQLLAVAWVQSAKLRRRKLILLFGLAPVVLSFLSAGPSLLLFNRAVSEGADFGPMFKFGMVLSWGKFLSMAGSLLALLLGATAVDRDIADATLFPVLAKPISRTRALFGKYLGSYYVLLIYWALSALILFVATTQTGPGASWWQIVRALATDLLVFATFLAMGLAAGLLFRPTGGLSLILGCAIWLGLSELFLQAHDTWLRVLGMIPLAVFPHTGFWDGWYNTASSGEADPIHVGWRLLYVLLWGALFLALSRWRFERRELHS